MFKVQFCRLLIVRPLIENKTLIADNLLTLATSHRNLWSIICCAPHSCMYENGTFCICYLPSWPFSWWRESLLPSERESKREVRFDRRSSLEQRLSPMAINGWNEIWSHLYWVGRSGRSDDVPLSLQPKVLFIFTRSSGKYWCFVNRNGQRVVVGDQFTRTQMLWHDIFPWDYFMYVLPRSCPLDKLAGYLRNLLGKEPRRKHRYRCPVF